MFVVRTILGLVAVAACGRIGFDGSDAIDGSVDTPPGDAPEVLGTIACAATRTPIVTQNPRQLAVEGASTPLVAWTTTDGAFYAGILDANDTLTATTTLFGPQFIDRVVSAHPIATGHAFVIEVAGVEALYALDATLTNATLRGSGRPGVGRGSLTGFGAYVFWGHVPTGQANAVLFERLDANGVPTAQSNRITGAEVRDLVIGGADDIHAHVVWAEANDTCTASELFGGVPDLVDIGTRTGCRSPRNASGVGDSLVTSYATPTGALRLYAVSNEYVHDIELSPAAMSPTLADDGTVVWATWFDGRVGGALVLAKIELSTSVVVTVRQLTGVAPVAMDAVALVADSSPAKIVVLEAGSLAVVEPCL
ncbi:MAG: hypothetical protein AB7T06_34330 [Kofleriaceae bacterium]